MSIRMSPKYKVQLIDKVFKAICNEFSTDLQAKAYLSQWHEQTNTWDANFNFIYKDKNYEKVDIYETLCTIYDELLIKIAIDIGVETPDYIPCIPTFKNTLKEKYSNSYEAFCKSFKQVIEQPDMSIGLANSTLESIIKQILKDERISVKYNDRDTLYKLSQKVLEEFKINPNQKPPNEIMQLGSSLLSACQAIESLRSDKTNFHGKTKDDYIIDDSMYAYFIVNIVSSIGLFIDSFYKMKYKDETKETPITYEEDLPF